jgi:hypothetical protein
MISSLKFERFANHQDRMFPAALIGFDAGNIALLF